MKNIEEIYCLSCDFVKFVDEKILKKPGLGRKSILTRAEYLTLAIMKQNYSIKTNKNLYEMIKNCTKNLFSKLPSYAQFNEGMNGNCPYLLLFLKVFMEINKLRSEGIYYIDSTLIPICSNAHRYSVKVDLGFASSGKNMNGWTHGFKLHLIINHNMEIVSTKFSSGSTNDLKAIDDIFINNLKGFLIGDKGYISSSKQKYLFKKGLLLITKNRKNMKQLPVSQPTLTLLKQRQKIETVFSELKHRFILVNRYARSLVGYFTQALAAVLTYSINKNFQNILLIRNFMTLLIS